MVAPAMAATWRLQTPPQTTTISAAMSPRVVRTPVIRPFSTSRPVTSVLAKLWSAPSSAALSRYSVPEWSASTTPTAGVWKPPRILEVSMYGTSAPTWAGVRSSESMPQLWASCRRRRSSCIRSGVRAISMPPVRVNVPWSSNSWMLSIDQIDVWREWSTANVNDEACPVEPPGLGSGPLSTRTMSRQPRRARCQARPLPTMPAPMMTTRACDGNALMSSPRLLD
jgi:hypothetical protein